MSDSSSIHLGVIIGYHLSNLHSVAKYVPTNTLQQILVSNQKVNGDNYYHLCKVKYVL